MYAVLLACEHGDDEVHSNPEVSRMRNTKRMLSPDRMPRMQEAPARAAGASSERRREPRECGTDAKGAASSQAAEGRTASEV